MESPRKHRYIIVRGVKYYNTNQIAFRIIYGHGFLEYYGPDEEHHILNVSSEVSEDLIEEALSKLGFNKSDKE